MITRITTNTKYYKIKATMTIKQIETASRIAQEIKIIDGEIIQIEKHAMLIANGEVEINLNLKIKDLTKKQEEDNKVKFDEDRSIITGTWGGMRSALDHYRPYGMRLGVDFGTGCGPTTPTNETSFQQDIKENAALQILGVLLYVAQSKREQLIKKLEKIGVIV
jgi:hypothetical protein